MESIKQKIMRDCSELIYFFESVSNPQKLKKIFILKKIFCLKINEQCSSKFNIKPKINLQLRDTE